MAVIRVAHGSTTYQEGERSPQRITREGQGPALWRRTVARALRLTGSTTPLDIALRDVSLMLVPGAVRCVCPHSTAGDARMIRAREAGML